VIGNLVQFPWRPKKLDHQESRLLAEAALATPPSDRAGKSEDLRLEDPELLLCVSEDLRSRLEATPALVREESDFFYRFLDKPVRQIGVHDEREYFLGEFALTAATASRFLFKVEEAKSWLRRAEANFALVQNSNAQWGRVSYQRLALALEAREFEEVLEVAPLWASAFLRLEMPEDALKCRFLEGTAHRELGDLPRAIQIFSEVCAEAERLASPRLTAQAANNLARYHADAGDTELALSFARKALPLLQGLGSQVHLVKLRWSMGELLRKEGKRPAALEAYRHAQSDARELGMRGDLAALHLVVADMLLEAGQDAQAEWEIRAALPIIDEEKMVPEGIAALSLLRDSLRHRQIDKQALRELHGYFQEK
jgi:tetratricopeptide (TPR) repeat protein